MLMANANMYNNPNKSGTTKETSLGVVVGSRPDYASNSECARKRETATVVQVVECQKHANPHWVGLVM